MFEDIVTDELIAPNWGKRFKKLNENPNSGGRRADPEVMRAGELLLPLTSHSPALGRAAPNTTVAMALVVQVWESQR